ncbi:imelysin family protein [Pyxidicoccus trucidator]|uniref:imelysin family protein n=1 Tax=Pyxidicoccus trucidator TaxID=2709662 RepID=UPI0013DCF1A5|nr:imelysin family protein [Pyxidicoccus trucidator]
MNTVSTPPLRRVSALALVLPVLLCLSACKEDGGGKVDAGTDVPDATAASRQALLTATGTCVLSSAREFLTAATALETAAAAHAAQPDATTRDAARSAFHDAMDRWQVLEVMQLGPAAPRNLPGGAELRDNVYSWPLVSRCAVEEQVVARGYEASGFPTTLVSRRGLAALEYLLFFEGADTACQSTSPIVSQGTWAALSQEERESRKRAYAVAAAADVKARATQLAEAWEADKGAFARTLETAGSGNTVYPTSQAALNSVSDALFYLEREVKDMKLARPLGLRECSTATCPEALESLFAKRSKANVRANLMGFRRLVQGCGTDYAGTGFDDLLEASGAGELAGRLRERLVFAEAGIAAVEEEDLAVALAQDKASVRALYDSMKGVTDILKTELVTTLDLELPQSVEGDND